MDSSQTKTEGATIGTKCYNHQTLDLPSLKGNSPVRGNVCEADKRVPVSGGKGGRRSLTEGLSPLCVLRSALCIHHCSDVADKIK